MHEETSGRTIYVHLNFFLPLTNSQSNFNDIKNSHLDAVGARQHLSARFCYLHEDPIVEMYEVDKGRFPRDQFGIVEIDHDGVSEDYYRSVACPTLAEAEKMPVAIPSNGIEGIRIAQKPGIYESYVGGERESRWRWN
jgi:hypothetical protein